MKIDMQQVMVLTRLENPGLALMALSECKGNASLAARKVSDDRYITSLKDLSRVGVWEAWTGIESGGLDIFDRPVLALEVFERRSSLSEDDPAVRACRTVCLIRGEAS